MKVLFQRVAICAFAACLASCATNSAGYHPGGSGVLIVKREFQFTVGPRGIARVHHTYTIPAGVYLAQGTDSKGTYYAVPKGWMSFKVGIIPDRLHGGLYRSGGQISVYSQPFNTMGIILTGGGNPTVMDPVPGEYHPLIIAR